MKKIFKALLALLMTFTATGCGSTSKEPVVEETVHYVDEEFLIDFEAALLNRLDMGEEGSSNKELIDSEYRKLSKYNDLDLEWEDNKIKGLAYKYISGIEEQKKAIDDKLEFIEYSLQWYKGAVTRYDAIVEIFNNYDVFKDDRQKIENSYVNLHESIKYQYAGLTAVADDAGKQLDVDFAYDWNTQEFIIPLKNNTKYSYNVGIYMEFYTSDDVRTYTTSQSFYDIKPNSKNELRFYADSNKFTDGGYYRYWWNFTINE